MQQTFETSSTQSLETKIDLYKEALASDGLVLSEDFLATFFLHPDTFYNRQFLFVRIHDKFLLHYYENHSPLFTTLASKMGIKHKLEDERGDVFSGGKMVLDPVKHSITLKDLSTSAFAYMRSALNGRPKATETNTNLLKQLIARSKSKYQKLPNIFVSDKMFNKVW